MKILVVGGVAGGATAIARLRRLDENAEIILFEKGKYVSFANCGLPYYIGGAISQREALFVTTAADIEAKYNIDVRTENEVLSIDKAAKTVRVLNHATNEEYDESYDKLLLSTGSKPFVPKLEGVDEENVFTLWTVPDVDKIHAYIEQNKPKRAVVVGGGFIGLEMAENLVDRGIHVSLVEMAPHVMPVLDQDMAKLVENHLRSKGIDLHLGVGFQGTKDKGCTVLLNTGNEIPTDLVLLSIGARPQNDLALSAELELNERKGIRVDGFGRTSDPNIYAVGDVIGVEDYVLGGETMIPLAGPANKQGRAVAANMLGLGEDPYEGTMGTSVAKVFDLTVASVGASEKALERSGKKYKEDYFVTLVHPMSHAGYYPGALPMTLKLIFGADRKVLGAQAVGYDGVDKRIDVIATAIYFRGTVDDLSKLELAYAPPYSSAKDPVNFAGFTARNILDGLTTPVLYRELVENRSAYQILDVREVVETDMGMLSGAINIPLPTLRSRLGELDRNTNYLINCAVGLRGYVAERILKQNGFKASNLVGGYRSVMDAESEAHTPPASTDQDKIISEQNAGSNATGSGSAGSGSSASSTCSAASVSSPSTSASAAKVEALSVCGLSCPGPIVQVAGAMKNLSEGDMLDVTATDPGFARDIESWCANTGNTLLEQGSNKGQFTARIRKGAERKTLADSAPVAPVKEKTMIIFDGDLDKAIASFIIATGAASMGNKVHMFFTFWGLSILRKENAPKVKKDFMSKMFAGMLPKGTKKLGLSRMNFLGAGSKMIRGVMTKKGVTSLEELIAQALRMGVEITACQMSMDIMGLTKEELIDGVKIGGVATMLHDSDQSNMNLFV